MSRKYFFLSLPLDLAGSAFPFHFLVVLFCVCAHNIKSLTGGKNAIAMVYDYERIFALRNQSNTLSIYARALATYQIILRERSFPVFDFPFFLPF